MLWCLLLDNRSAISAEMASDSAGLGPASACHLLGERTFEVRHHKPPPEAVVVDFVLLSDRGYSPPQTADLFGRPNGSQSDTAQPSNSARVRRSAPVHVGRLPHYPVANITNKKSRASQVTAHIEIPNNRPRIPTTSWVGARLLQMPRIP